MNWRHFVRNSPLLYDLRHLWVMASQPGLWRRSQQYWRTNRGLHRGRAGFVIGNGPSLQMADLDRLAGWVTIASNKIYLAFDQTRWRPDYYTCVDKLVWEKTRNEIGRYFRRVHIISTMKPVARDIEIITCRMRGSYASRVPGFSDDMTAGVFGGWTVTYYNLQLAVHLGLNPIYIIGCDHYYRGETNVSRTGEVVAHQGLTNHFVANYRAPGEKVNSAPIELMEAAFLKARAFAEGRGIRILNATRGGHLEVFERCSLDSILESANRETAALAKDPSLSA